jgi:CheY-like chemotaxis protein
MRQKVLMADPDARFLWLAQRALAASLGGRYDITAVPDGDAAYAAIMEQRPSLAILGNGLAGRSALDITASFARSREHRDCRFIALLGPGEEALEKSHLDAGACGCLQKPFAAEVLAAQVVEIGELGPHVLEEKPFVILLGRGEQRARLEGQVARATADSIVPVDDAEVAVALARSPRCRALLVAEPIDGYTVEALFEYIRSERIRVPFVRIGPGRSPHPFALSLRPEFEGAELASIFARLDPDAPIAPPRAARREPSREAAREPVREPPSERSASVKRYVGF